MATEKQRQAARRNITAAASAAKKKRMLAHLPRKTKSGDEQARAPGYS